MGHYSRFIQTLLFPFLSIKPKCQPRVYKVAELTAYPYSLNHRLTKYISFSLTQPSLPLYLFNRSFLTTMTQQSPIELHAFTHNQRASTIALNNDSQPRRPKASPRPTPSPSSGPSTPSPLEELEDFEPGDPALSSGQESPVRGRTRAIVASLTREPPPLAIPRRRAGPSSIDFDDHRVSHRLMSKDLSISPEELDSCILESYPTGHVNLNVAEILSEASSSLQSPVDWNGFAGHRDTFALQQMYAGCVRPLRPGLPRNVFERLEQYIDFDTYLSLRLSCRCWSEAISSVRPLRFATAASVLPVEIVQRIYAQLSSIDFNAARHCCRSWLLASLGHKLLVQMLQRGGWWSAAQADMTLIEERGPRGILSGEWLLSKRLTTECSLRPDWTGNGLSGENQDHSSSRLRESSMNSPNGRIAFESFILDSEVDFSALSLNGHSAEEGLHTSDSRFTISVCGKYLLVTIDCTIYIYSLNNQASINHRAQSPIPVERLTSLVCPHRVLAVSMDTSYGRFAVAALLQGRAGFVCDLRELGTVSQWPSHDAYLWDPALSALWEDRDSVADSTYLSGTYSHRFSSPVSPGRMEALPQRNSSNHSTDPFPPAYPSAKQTSMPVVPGLSSVFYNLGSAINSPLSVAICAQRRCIAFGCSSAVELHWVDALTGQGLNRWFSIPAGGEMLYFFPERNGERKMRVIGSETVPDAWRVAKDDPSAPGQSDYYNAIPLSDGIHVLFANRFSAELCLGIETPPTATVIDAGYMRLETRAIFEGPLLMNGKGGRMVPRIFEAARDLRWGGRVVAGFGDEVWVFAVPGDILKERTAGCRNKNRNVAEDDDDDDDGEARTSVLRFGGIRVGQVEGLARVGICADGGGVLVRGIGRAGLFKEWRLTSRSRNVKRWVVRSDGSVVTQDEFDGTQSEAVERDADGDVVMKDYVRRDSSSCYDDDATGGELANGDYNNDDDDDEDGGVRLEFDLDGDVIMRDVGVYYGGGVGGGEEEELDEGYFSDEPGRGSGTLAIHPADAGYWREGERIGIRKGGAGQGKDTEEDLWELSRMEVEVFGGCKG